MLWLDYIKNKLKKCTVIMSSLLPLLLWITALKMSLSFNPPLPPFWGWERHYYDIYQNWEVRASPQYQFAPFQDYERQFNIREDPNCDRTARTGETHDSRMNERSIPSSKTVQLNYYFKPNRRSGQTNNNPITFPGESSRAGVEPNIPESCRNSTFCEDVPDYPQSEIDALLKKLGNAVRFTIDRLADTPDINQRVGPIEENVDMCLSEEKVVYPKVAQDADGKWHTLVNRDVNPVQGYRVEVCNLSHGPGCASVAVFNQGYEAKCKQKYVYRKVTAVERSMNGELVTFDTDVKVPSCCACVASYTIV